LGLSPESRDPLRDPLQTGVTIVGVTAVFGGAGWWLDLRIHTFPVLMIIGAALGLFGAIYLMVLRLREADRKSKPNGDSNQNNA